MKREFRSDHSVATNERLRTARAVAPRLEATPLSASERRPHLVEFYASDAEFRDVVSRFVAEGLAAGEGVLLIITRAHRQSFQDAPPLDQVGFDSALERGQLVFADANEVLEEFLVNSMPDPGLFQEAILRLVPQGSFAGKFRAFGEMVDVLWARGDSDAAIHLERLWCNLQGDLPFLLLCAYGIANFSQSPDDLRRVCSLHTHTGELRSRPPNSGERWRSDGAGQAPGDATQQGEPEYLRTLIAEIARRQEVERALHESLRELRGSETSLREKERLLGEIADAVPALVSYVDATLRYRFVNAAYERWFGRPKHTILDRHMEDVLGSEAYAQVRERATAALAGQAQSFTERISYRDAGERLVHVSYVPHFADGEHVDGFVVLVNDVTERERLSMARQAAAERTQQLMRITSALAEAVTPHEVFRAVVDEVAAALGASSAGLFQLDEATLAVTLQHSLGYSEAALAAMRSMSLHDSLAIPAIDAIRIAQPVWVGSQRELLDRYPHLAPAVTLGRSYQVACLPVLVQGRARGSLAFTFDDVPPMDEEQQDFLQLVTRYCSQALERLGLLTAERTNRGLAERSAARAGLLSRASRAFAEAGTDLPAVLQTIMEQLTAEYAELCGIALVSGDRLHLAALHHRDPDAKRGLEEAAKHFPPTLSESASGQVIRTGESSFIPEVDPQAVLQQARPPFRSWLERYMPRSLIIAPLRARARIIGTVGAMRGEGAPPFTVEDVRFLEELGERAGMAIEGSRLHNEGVQARLRTELLYRLARTVIAAEEVQQVFDAALDALERAVDARRAAILTFDRDGVMRFKAWRGLSEAYRRAVEGHSPWPANARDPEVIFIPDVLADDALSSFRPLFEQEQIGALGFIPLVAGGLLVGKFMVYYDQPRRLGEHELKMAGAIANHVAAATARFAALADLRQAVRFNEMFTGMLGHDLRNPLGAIMTAAQLLIRRTTDERTTKPLARIISSGQRMARMIDQLLDFTRVRVGRGFPIEPQSVDLIRLLRQVVDELEGSEASRPVRLLQEGDAIGDWDGDRLSQVFSNLVANALQHGRPERDVVVRVDGRQRELVRVQVHNDGVIPENTMLQLFEPMARSDPRGHRSRGLGLGLYISQQIMLAHGGALRVESNEDDGTTFTASLPRGSAAGVEP